VAHAGRPRAITGRTERELEALLSLGVRQATAARALGVGQRTVERWVHEQRARPEPTLEELLSEFQAPVDVEAILAAPARPLRPARKRPSWMRAAERVERLEAEQLDSDDAA
jgi:hypothetical protein